MRVEMRSIASIKPYENNPRLNDLVEAPKRHFRNESMCE
jgi:hypothetical protein